MFLLTICAAKSDRCFSVCIKYISGHYGLASHATSRHILTALLKKSLCPCHPDYHHYPDYNLGASVDFGKKLKKKNGGKMSLRTQNSLSQISIAEPNHEQGLTASTIFFVITFQI